MPTSPSSSGPGYGSSLHPRVMVIDDHPEFRQLLVHHLTTRWPEASVLQYDPLTAGKLPEQFSGAGHDLVLLGDPAGRQDALEWLARFRVRPGFPPVLFFGNGDERQIVRAVRLGAADYLTKHLLTHSRLVEALETALAVHHPAGADAGDLRRLGSYRTVRRLAGGGLSSVYLCRERGSERELVLKVLSASGLPEARPGGDAAAGERILDRFLQEYELIAGIRHPNVIRIHDLGIADDHAFIVMEYCSGGSLKRRIASGLEPGHALALMRDVAGALGALHRVGILHRDLKPTNVLFRADESLALIDFGLAKQAELRAELTAQGAIFGTPYYMSPEQGHGEPVDARGDIYSLGVMLYEMLTGRKPYDGTTAMSVIVQHRQAPVPVLPEPLRRYQPLLERMMAKLPEERFESVDELLGSIADSVA